MQPTLPKVENSMIWHWVARIRRMLDVPLMNTVNRVTLVLENLFVTPVLVSKSRAVPLFAMTA